MLAKKQTREIFNKLIQALDRLGDFDVHTIENACRQIIAEQGIPAGELIHPVRAALTGKRVGPGLFELMAVLGKDKVLQRLKEAQSAKLKAQS